MTPPAAHAGLEFVLAHIIQDFMQFMHQTGLSRPQIHALLLIYHAGECRISEIGALTGSSPAAASQLVERLVTQGLVQRSEDPLNRRIKKLRLTERSLRVIHHGISSNHVLLDLMAALPRAGWPAGPALSPVRPVSRAVGSALAASAPQ